MASLTSLLGSAEQLATTFDNLDSKINGINKGWDEVAENLRETTDELENSISQYNNLESTINSLEYQIKAYDEQIKTATKTQKKALEEEQLKLKTTQKAKQLEKESLEQKYKDKKANLKDLADRKKEKDKEIAEAKRQGGVRQTLANIKNNPVIQVIDTVIKIVEGAIKIATQYMVVGYENQLRALQAITTSNVNTMKANLGLWTDSLKGAYEAQNLSMSSNLAMIEAQNATDLANKKLANMWTNWIPIWGTLNKYAEEEMRLEQQIQETRLKNAMEYIQTAEGYAQKTDQYGLKQDEAIRRYTRSVGLSENQTRAFEKRALAMNNSLARINATMDDALKIQMGMQEQSGRLIGFSDEDYMKSTAVGQIMGAENVAKFEAEMVLFNKSVESSTSIMEDMYAYANRMGLSQKKLTQNVLNNLKLANKYQFKGGVKGFIEFAKWAENIRFNVAQLGNMIEKIQTGGLEGIIKQTAQLQVLGGGFAMHADPFRMAFNAFMDPESLAKDFYDSLKGEGLFDTATGELTQGIASQMRLRAASEAYGFSYEDARTMIRERTRKENAMSQLRGSNFSEEQRNAIANVAQRDENGNWFVNTLQGRKGLNELKPKDLENLLTNESDKDLVKYAEKTLSLTEIISRTALKIDALIGGMAFDDLVDTTKATAKITQDGFKENAQQVLDGIELVHVHNVEAAKKQIEGLKSFGQKVKEAYETQKEANEYVGKIYDLLLEQYGHVEERKNAQKGVTMAKENFDTAVKDRIQTVKDYGANSAQANVAEEKETEAAYQKELAEWAQEKILKSQSNWFGAKWLHQIRADQAKQRMVKNERDLGLTDSEIEERRNDARNRFRRQDTLQVAEAEVAQDAFASAGGMPMAVAAKDITSIHDGLAVADRRDSAVFAKTGGPFDKLFNGIFERINTMYKAFGYDRGERFGRMSPLPYNPVKEMPREMGIEQLAPRGQGGSGEAIRFEPLKIEMNGRLELSSGGKSVDIMNELQNNPLLVREIAKMLSDSLSSKFYGGKSRYNAGQNTYFR